jgi:hypothetical protein
MTSWVDIGYSDVLDGWPGTGNINEDPRFVDQTLGDYHLQPGSPCLSKGALKWVLEGQEYRAPDEDIEGRNRPLPIGNSVDMGAYERYDDVPTFSALPNIVGSHIVLDVLCANTEGIERYSLGVSFPDSLELVEGSSHIEGVDTLEESIVASLVFRIWEGGTMNFQFTDVIVEYGIGKPEVPTHVGSSIEVLSSPDWDINRDYVVNVLDLVIVASDFGTKVTDEPRPNPDVNRDGVVNVADLVAVGTHIGESYSSVLGAPVLLEPYSHDTAVSDHDLLVLLKVLECIGRNNLDEPGLRRIESIIGELAKPGVRQTCLLPNYPNPFNPDTWIPFQLSEQTPARISIHDIKGNLVKILDLGNLEPGRYVSKDRAAYWDGRNEMGESVRSGVYYYTIESDNLRNTRKMLLLK